MQTHPKKRIEIIIEAPLRKRLVDLLNRNAVKGYTVLPAAAGGGLETSWHREGQVTDAGQMVMVVCIVDQGQADAIVEAVYELLSRHHGIVSLSDVEVIRSERF